MCVSSAFTHHTFKNHRQLSDVHPKIAMYIHTYTPPVPCHFTTSFPMCGTRWPRSGLVTSLVLCPTGGIAKYLSISGQPAARRCTYSAEQCALVSMELKNKPLSGLNLSPHQYHYPSLDQTDLNVDENTRYQHQGYTSSLFN